jgi:hypothetical protein
VSSQPSPSPELAPTDAVCNLVVSYYRHAVQQVQEGDYLSAIHAVGMGDGLGRHALVGPYARRAEVLSAIMNAVCLRAAGVEPPPMTVLCHDGVFSFHR